MSSLPCQYRKSRGNLLFEANALVIAQTRDTDKNRGVLMRYRDGEIELLQRPLLVTKGVHLDAPMRLDGVHNRRVSCQNDTPCIRCRDLDVLSGSLLNSDEEACRH